MYRRILDKEEIKKNTRKIVEQVLFMVKKFKPTIIFILFLFVCFRMKKYYDSRFKYDKIVSIVNKKSRYVGNTVLLRDDYFLTTAEEIAKTCIKTKPEDNIFYYIIINDTYYKANIVTYDFKTNLALLKIENNSNYGKFETRNFAMFPADKNINLINQTVFISKSLNNRNNFFFDEYKINGIGNYGLLAKSFDNVRKNTGEIVLNDKLEFVGITAGNTTRGTFSKFKNNINIVDVNKIKSFLKANKFYYFENKQNIDLYKVKNYLKSINGKVICYVDVVPNRFFVTIER